MSARTHLFPSLHSVFHWASFILMLACITEAKTVVAVLSILSVVQKETEHFFQQLPQKSLDFSSMSPWPKLDLISFLKPISVHTGQRFHEPIGLSLGCLNQSPWWEEPDCPYCFIPTPHLLAEDSAIFFQKPGALRWTYTGRRGGWTLGRSSPTDSVHLHKR